MKSLLPLIFTLTTLMADSEIKRPVGAEVALISENSHITGGETFKVGFQIHHQAGYHTYWQNPGIAGVATQLVWNLPEGFTAGPVQWPYPERAKMAGYSIYGYERDVLLVVEIKAPAHLSAASVTLKVAATWMACADGCYPGNQPLEVALPVAESSAPNPATVALFAKTKAEIPAPLDGWSVQLLAAKDAKEVRLILKPNSQPATTMGEPYFFSADGQISSERPQPVTSHADGSCEILLSRANESPLGKTTLPGVLKFAGTPESPAPRFAEIAPAYLENP
jgi:DsbC/DsbD-like thiol-disulfide interchange protein